MGVKFSVVVDIGETDWQLAPKTLPSWLALGSSEVILCVDKPMSDRLRKAIEGGTRGDRRVTVVEVPHDPEWQFHQAHVRRSGFKAVSNDVILTGDIDVIPNGACLKAVEMVGKDDLALASLSKRRGGGTLGEAVRNVTKRLVRRTTGRTYFTGLYALYRPFWLDSEKEEEVRKIPHPESPGFQKGTLPYRGEDAILRDYVSRNHRVVYLPDVGGTDLRTALGDREVGQVKMGVKYSREGRPFGYVLLRSLIYARGKTMGTYADDLARRKGVASVVSGYFTAIPNILRLSCEMALWHAGVLSAPPRTE